MSAFVGRNVPRCQETRYGAPHILEKNYGFRSSFALGSLAPQHFSDHCEPQLEHGWYLTYSSSCRGESCLRK